MSPADLARFGHLAATRGVWKSEHLISAEWVRSHGPLPLGYTPMLAAGAVRLRRRTRCVEFFKLAVYLLSYTTVVGVEGLEPRRPRSVLIYVVKGQGGLAQDGDCFYSEQQDAVGDVQRVGLGQGRWRF